MKQEKQIFDFLFEKFKQNENSKMNIANLVLELSTQKKKFPKY